MLDAHRPDVSRLIAGPALDGSAEPWAAHLARLGDLPRGRAERALIGELEASGLLGRGGAGFPVGRKWRALAERQGGRAVVVANGAEGEPASWKDRALMVHRPHLVIDGARLAADAIGAGEVVFYVGGEHQAAVVAMRRALLERRDAGGPRMRLETAPVGYVAGEATAVVHWLNAGDARPTMTPPRVSQRGVGGHPTLVQNVESLAYAALIARRGADWYRTAGRTATAGTALVTLSGAVERPGLYEIELGTPVAELAAQAGARRGVHAVLVGGYAGSWVPADDAWRLVLDPAELRERGLSFGCGVVVFLPAGTCGVFATSRLIAYLADEGAGQCGPCAFGLPAIARAVSHIAMGPAGRDLERDLDDVARRTALLAGRGACHHPDGAAQLVTSALRVFADEFDAHARFGRCSAREGRLDVA
jgi:NADH:ubiquinone oxidoreductase subunit F (NADH-binding)